ncbi:MAG: precorrin-6y C5,15-methyltransferase (decarboxylating) subunit CbiE [Pseudomonadota bacterium]
MAREITIVGCGPGSPDYLTPAAVEAVERAEVLVGAKRLLELFPASAAERIFVGADVDGVLTSIDEKARGKPVAVLVTGDPGLFSLAGRVIARFGRETCRVIPGISSVQAAFAELGLDWWDAKIVSAHKELPNDEAVAGLVASEKVAVLGGRADAGPWIAGLVKRMEPGRRIFVLEDITLPNERVYETSCSDLEAGRLAPRSVILIVKAEALR